jgi:DNA polymerase-3 subunit gamma/tau
MSYQVLARKWRPRIFREMVGQGHVLQALVNALDNDRLHHAYLFTGTRGVGKTTVARILARCLNCERGVSSEPCGECASCLEISEGRSIDLIEVDAASRTKVEDTRELLENVQYAPTHSRFKVYLIDEVHMLSTSSFNALLKTLEEPPPHVKFLLATTDPQKLPATVLSRCLQFHLKNMSPELIVGHLQTVLAAESIANEDPALWLLARAADGSMRDALSLTDQAISVGAGSLSEVDVRSMLGSIELSFVYRLLQAVTAQDAAQALEVVEAMSEHAPDYAGCLAEMASMLHRVAVAQAVPQAIDNSWGDAAAVEELAAMMTAEDAQLFYQLALTGRRDIGLAPDLRGGLEMVLLRMIAFRPAVVVDESRSGELLEGEAREASATGKKSEAGAPVEPPPAPATAPVSGATAEQLPSLSNLAEQEATEDRPASDDFAPRLNEAPVAASATDELHRDSIEAEVLAFESPAAKDPGPAATVPEVAQPEPRAASDAALETAGEKSELSADNAAVPQATKPDIVATGAANSATVVPIAGAAITTVLAPIEQETLSSPDNSLQPAPDLPAEARIPLEPARWHELLEALGLTGIVYNIASHSELQRVESDRIWLLLDAENGSLYSDNMAERIAVALSSYCGDTLSVKVEMGVPGTETPALRRQRMQRERQQQAVQAIEQDPRVQMLVDRFGGVLDHESIAPVNH